MISASRNRLARGESECDFDRSNMGNLEALVTNDARIGIALSIPISYGLLRSVIRFRSG